MDAWMYFIKLCFAVMKPMAFESTAKVLYFWSTHISEKFPHSLYRIDEEISELIQMSRGMDTPFSHFFFFVGLRWASEDMEASQVHDSFLLFTAPVKILSILLEHLHGIYSSHHLLKS